MSSSVSAILLTGATGLVGGRLLAELLRRGTPVVALVRGSDAGHAQQRVEQLLGPLEASCWLPRPRVLCGNLQQPGLGLSSEDRAYLSRLRLKVLHCAASIRFQAEQPAGEPYATNVAGTRNLLELCGALDVEEFHHVSTAYVGCRTAARVVREQRVEEGSPAGNDYELSKIRAENLILAQKNFPVTIHRPSIVVGDSNSGWTTTFHGFYAPLQIGAQFANFFGFSAEAGDWFRQQLGLQPEDSKNLIPVDWLAACIAKVVSQPRQQRLTSEADEVEFLHWTHPTPVPCQTMQAAIVTAIAKRYGSQPQSATARDLPTPEQFATQMQVYASYFNSDPTFDNRQAQAACPDLPCPVLDLPRLTRLADYALAANFGWPKQPLRALPHAGLVAVLRSLPTYEAGSPGGDGSIARGGRNESLQGEPDGTATDERWRLTLLGDGAPETLYYGRIGRDWFRWPDDRKLPPPAASCRLPLAILAECATGKSTPARAIEQGYWVIEGHWPNGWLAIIEDWMNHVISRYSASQRLHLLDPHP